MNDILLENSAQNFIVRCQSDRRCGWWEFIAENDAFFSLIQNASFIFNFRWLAATSKNEISQTTVFTYSNKRFLSSSLQ